MSCNLTTGMYQRLDTLGKNALARATLFGTSNNRSISGVWVYWNEEHASFLSLDWQVDFQLCTWWKLGRKSQETYTLVWECFCGTLKQTRNSYILYLYMYMHNYRSTYFFWKITCACLESKLNTIRHSEPRGGPPVLGTLPRDESAGSIEGIGIQIS